MIKTISVTSLRDLGNGQIIKDSLTPTEKKILIHMLNAGMDEGQVKKKLFYIEKTGKDTANVKIGTITHSFLLGRDEIINHEIINQRVKIKFK